MMVIFTGFFIGLILSLWFNNFGIFIVNGVGLLILFFCQRGISKRTAWTISAILLVLSFVVVVVYFGQIAEIGIPYSTLGNDDYNFELIALPKLLSSGKLTLSSIKHMYIERGNTSRGFILILVWMDYISRPFGGYHTLMIRMFNMYLWLSVGVLAVKYMLRHGYGDDKQCRYVLYAITLFPNSVFISAHCYRDTIVAFIMFLLVFMWDGLVYATADRNKRIQCSEMYSTADSLGNSIVYNSRVKTSTITRYSITVILSLPLVYYCYYIRAESIFINLANVVVCVLVNSKKDISVKKLGWGILVTIGVIMIFNQLDFMSKFTGKVELYTAFRKETTKGGLSNYIFATPLLPFGIVLRLLWAMVCPFPGNLINISTVFDSVAAFFSILISIGVIWQIMNYGLAFEGAKDKDKVFFLYLMNLVIVSVTTFTFRHFLMMYPYLMILIARGRISTSKEKAMKQKLLILTVLFGLAIIYIMF